MALDIRTVGLTLLPHCPNVLVEMQSIFIPLIMKQSASEALDLRFERNSCAQSYQMETHWFASSERTRFQVSHPLPSSPLLTTRNNWGFGMV